MEICLLSVLVLCNTALLKSIIKSIGCHWNGIPVSLRISRVAKTENLFRFVTQSIESRIVTCYMPILACFEMWRSIASTMSGSKDKNRFISIFSATCMQTNTNIGRRKLLILQHWIFWLLCNFAGHELLVWYGDDYASDLGIDKSNYSASVIPGEW